MRNKKIIILLIITILLIGCSEKNEKKEPIQLMEVSSGGSTIYQNDNIKIKIADNIDEKENIYTSILNELQKIDEFSPIENLEIEISKQYIVPNIDKIIKCDTKFIETEEFKKELIKKSYGIYDNWISEGLYGKIFGQDKTIGFSTYYSNNDFSLFGARFFEPFSTKEEVDNVKSASIDLVEYILKNNKKEELLKNNINISDIEEWAEEKGIDLSYQREIESLMNRMEVYDISDKFIINTREEINGFKIDISIAEIKAKNNITEQYDTAEKIEQIILMFDRDILAIKKGIEEEAPKFYAEYKEILNNVPKIEYIFYTNADVYADGYVSQGSKRVSLRDITTHAHEYCHFFFYSPFIDNGIAISTPSWIDEGMADYFDVVYSESNVETLKSFFDIKSNYTEDIAIKDSTYSKFKEIKSVFDKELDIYVKNDIDINNIEEIAKDKNKRILENHVRVFSKVKVNEIWGSKLKEESVIADQLYEGNTMNYHKNCSFFNYLVEEYGLDKILYLNVTNIGQLTYKEVFGKTFDELKVDWMNYLKENIKGIESIL
ncbi:hypothetical protein RBU61_17275 [Tissierella sp. MB52-C2]|uniref:hypothetical protein n=1 Tax=Tissierella sp. MB52-C2 TaxID=3070999 RepID=UPI00280BE0E7|nr:hypothetical protein [Tissierella sp. MB52-C2]WMM24657.1 hypothetical protein RBU61_17275 [Tissierella sp. MB52-C2]